MAGKPVTVARLPTTDPHLRNELIERLTDMANDIYEEEDGTTKYAVLIPRQDDGKTVWVFEEFADQTANDLHLASYRVQDITAWFRTVPIFSDSDPAVIHDFESISSDFEFTRPQIKDCADPYVVFDEVTYMPGGFAGSKPYWEAIVESSREKEPGTLSYDILKDLREEEIVATFEVYESEEYARDVHAQSGPVRDKVENTTHLRAGLKHHVLKKIAGFLDR